MPVTTRKLQSHPHASRIANGCALVIVATCIVLTILAESERLWWRAYLVAQFRVEIFALCSLIAIALVSFRGSAVLATSVSLCALLSFSHLIPYYIPRTQPPMVSEKSLKLMQINLNVKNKQYEAVTAYIQRIDPDAVLLAELTPEWRDYLTTHLKTHPHSVTDSRIDTYGIGIYCKKAPKNASIEYLGKSGHPSIVAELQGLEKSVHLLHTHVQGPVKEQFFAWHKGQFEAMQELVKELPPPLVVSGDLNANAWTYLISDFLNKSGLVDTQWGRGIRLTWPTPFYWRYGFCPLLAIDHFFVSDDVIVKRKDLGIPNSSDHYPVVIEISL
jgi:endonuclease/exonuclease/phosphatase (EEP) superfamily protein YafD